MPRKKVKLSIPFDSLLQSVRELGVEDKRRLWKMLDEELALAEEKAWKKDAGVASEIAEARAAYKAGDYVTLEEYASRGKRKT